MKKHLVGIIILLILTSMAGISMAELIHPISIEYTGDANITYYNKEKIIDGFIPQEYTFWQTNTAYWWGTGGEFTIDYGKQYIIKDILVSVDNNDDYKVDYSVDKSNWSNLFTIDKNYGEVWNGMDTMSTDSGHAEYITQIDFTPVTAQYLKIYATGGDNKYAVGEFQAYGSPVPVPGAVWLLCSGILGLIGVKRRIKN